MAGRARSHAGLRSGDGGGAGGGGRCYAPQTAHGEQGGSGGCVGVAGAAGRAAGFLRLDRMVQLAPPARMHLW